jgi:hypothetical protein
VRPASGAHDGGREGLHHPDISGANHPDSGIGLRGEKVAYFTRFTGFNRQNPGYLRIILQLSDVPDYEIG